MAVAALRTRLRARSAEPGVRQTRCLQQAEDQIRDLESALVANVRTWVATAVAELRLPAGDPLDAGDTN